MKLFGDDPNVDLLTDEEIKMADPKHDIHDDEPEWETDEEYLKAQDYREWMEEDYSYSQDNE